VRERHAAAWGEKPQLENPGYVKYRKGGEPHATTPELVERMHELVAASRLRAAGTAESSELYERYAALVEAREAVEPRDLLELVPGGPEVPVDEVEPVSEIVRRFSSGAMSHGALSSEAHETIAVALNMIGARSNSGEGGEAPHRYRDERNSKIKQIASARFGGTADQRPAAGATQSKITQGSEP